MSFDAVFFVSLGVLIVVAIIIGTAARGRLLGILVDSRLRYSLTHFQIVTWTIVILSTLIAAAFIRKFDLEGLVIPATLLGLMGINAGSAVLTTGIKAAKDARGKDLQVARSGAAITRRGGEKETIEPKLSQIWLLEEGEQADEVVDITKFQGLVITVVVVIAYVVLMLREKGFPELSESVVYLIGISHAGYVGGKVPDRKP